MSNNLEKIQRIAKMVTIELNSIKMDGNYLRQPCTVDTYVQYVDVNEKGDYEISFRTSELKIGGYEDDDNNDELLEHNLRANFRKILRKQYPNVSITGEIYGEKGSWYFTVEFKDEKKKNNTKKKLLSELEKYKNELLTFNDNVAKRIRNQKSKKKTCPSCESNINKDFFKSHKCPVCHKEMYTDTDSKRVNNLKDRIKTRETALRKQG